MTQQLITRDDIVCSIMLRDKTVFEVTKDVVQMYQHTYPSIDIYQQLNEMAMWAYSNPSKRKTRRGILRFINSWLSRSKPSSSSQSTRSRTLQEDFNDYSWAKGYGSH